MSDQIQNSKAPTTPSFAVVGRVNEGKSSVVAALLEDETIEIGPEPGTTTVARSYPLAAGGETLINIIDTPGFQEPEAALEWLRTWMLEKGASAADRSAAVRAFLGEFRGKSRFADETALLAPIMDGAAIIYVVDSSHPFRASYECEMEILQWTGVARVALLNRTGKEDFTPVWKGALKQYFSRAQSFDAHANLFEERIDLLTLLSHLVEEQAAAVKQATRTLIERDDRRTALAARSIARTVVKMLRYTLSEPRTDEFAADRRRQLEDQFAAGLRRTEADGRDDVEAIYSYQRLERLEPRSSPDDLRPDDLFSQEVWRFLGLSAGQLIAAGATGGALVGGMVDAAVAGHSFLLGTIIGAGIGGAGVAYAALREPDAKIFGVRVAGQELIAGPHRDPRFAWVALDRALLHQRAVARRPHSVRTPLMVEEEIKDANTSPDRRRGIVSRLDTLTTGKIKRALDRARKNDSEKNLDALSALIAAVIRERRAAQN